MSNEACERAYSHTIHVYASIPLDHHCLASATSRQSPQSVIAVGKPLSLTYATRLTQVDSPSPAHHITSLAALGLASPDLD